MTLMNENLMTNYVSHVLTFDQLQQIEALLKIYAPDSPVKYQLANSNIAYGSLETLAAAVNGRSVNALSITMNPSDKPSVYITCLPGETRINVLASSLEGCGIFYALTRILRSGQRRFTLVHHTSSIMLISLCVFVGITLVHETGLLPAQIAGALACLPITASVVALLIHFVAKGKAELAPRKASFFARKADDIGLVLIGAAVAVILDKLFKAL